MYTGVTTQTSGRALTVLSDSLCGCERLDHGAHCIHMTHSDHGDPHAAQTVNHKWPFAEMIRRQPRILAYTQSSARGFLCVSACPSVAVVVTRPSPARMGNSSRVRRRGWSRLAARLGSPPRLDHGRHSGRVGVHVFASVCTQRSALPACLGSAVKAELHSEA